MLTARELAAVLAGLRIYQSGGTAAWYDIHQIATNAGTHEPLAAEEVDALCQRLNMEAGT